MYAGAPAANLWLPITSGGQGSGSGAAGLDFAPELLAMTATGLAYNRRAVPRTYAMPDGTPVAIGNVADLAPPESDLFLNPFTKFSMHHRAIGAGAIHYIPGGVPIANWNAGNYAYIDGGALNDMTLLRQKIGSFLTGGTNQGRKAFYRVSSGDPDRVMNKRGGGETTTIKMPTGDNVVGGGDPYYPTYSANGDFTYGFAYRNGLGTPTADWFSAFDYAGQAYDAYKTWALDISDTQETAGDYLSAARLRWPGSVLRGFEINPTNPAPIRHALNCTVTRHSRASGNPAPASCHILNSSIVYPAWGVDSTANPANGGYEPTDNQGFLPYGSLLRVRPGADYAALKAALAGNARGLVLLDTMTYFGCYVVDGNGSYTTQNGFPQGLAQLRVDNEFGRQLDGTAISNVDTDCDAALTAMLPYLYVVGNRRTRTTETEIWPGDGYPYSGGGGPLGPASFTTAYDR